MTLPNGWKRMRLADFIVLQRGFDLPTRERVPGRYKVLSSGATAGSHHEARVEGPGFVVGRATNIGRPTWSDEDYWPLNTVLYAKDYKGNDPRFAYYWFLATDLSAFNSGSVQPMLNRNYIANIEIDVPPLWEQKEIARTLEVLDARIDSDHRALGEIDELASVIFAEWRESTPSVRRTTFGDYADVFGGSTPKTGVVEYWDGGIPWTTPTDVTRLKAPYLFATARTISDAGLANTATVLHPAGTIFMTSRATIGAFAINQIPASTNQGFIALRPHRDIDRWFLFEEMRSRVSDMLELANGSTFLEISRGSFKQMPLEVPADSAIEELHDRLEPLRTRGAHLSSETAELARLRDLLLPELLAGRVRVPGEQPVIQEASA